VTEAETAYEVRAQFENLLERDLLGPWDGTQEELPPGSTPGERYLLGRLVPRRPDNYEPASEAGSEDDDVEDRPELVEEPTLDLAGDEDDESAPAAAIRTRAMASSSLGLAFTVADDVDRIAVTASWGRYERGPSETHVTETGRPRTVWKRVPAGGQVEIPTVADDQGESIPDSEQDAVQIRWRVRYRGGRRIVELFLVNAQPIPPDLPDRARLFQAALEVTALDGAAAIFLGHNDPSLPELGRHPDDEQWLLALQHREQRQYAVGRLCAVDAAARAGETRAWRLRTTCFPAADVNMVVAGDPKDTPGLVLDMGRLGSPDLQPDDLTRALRPLVDGYRRWLDDQDARIDDDPEIARFADVARPAMQRARAVADRLDRSVDLLAANPQAREAFRFANQAMARQRVRSEIVRRRIADPGSDLRALQAELDVPKNRSWRPFQLAFILLCLPGLTDPAHEDAHRGPLLNGDVQLLFFPTGGGKTEAYLGLTAYTIAIRRLQGTIGAGDEARNGADGVAVLMRYTLRLLTAQQFQRATALICACELLRRERIDSGDLRWGGTPIRIGLWVGVSVTPNSFEDAMRQMEDATSRSAEGQVGGIQQFANCPWCGSAIDLGRDGHIDRARRRFLLYCGDPDGRCSFSRNRSTEGIPALVVDEEIYRLTPALLIGTVDKFAALPWRPATAHLFGHVNTCCDRHGYRNPDTEQWCRAGGHPTSGTLPATVPVAVQLLRPPDLIIQDELHLISDALGSMVGLYESLIDHLCTRTQDGAEVRPMFVASTATARRAREQVRQVFARGLTIFPPPLLDAGDTFFSRRVAPSPATPSRRYRGILATGERLTAIEIRVMTAVLEYGQYLFDQHGGVADPYMTAVDYFTSTRELAGMRRLVEDDITDRLGRQSALVRRRRPVVAELTSRMDSRKITQSLADLERRFTRDGDSTQALEALRQLTREERDARTPPPRPVDVLLATSMLQVGVDVQRLGLMVVTGQPKNMAEYIQASSRVGRSIDGPGLVLTIYQWNRPRDLAHYENFGYEHATFGHRVEGLTTTPFSKRALDRGLTGVVVGLVRHSSDTTLPNLGAQVANVGEQANAAMLERLRCRAEIVADDAATGTEVAQQTIRRLDRWMQKRVKLPTGQLGYEADGQAAAGLLRPPDEPPWELWSAPRSLRDVEPEILLQLRRDDPSWENAPAWDFTPPPAAAGGQP
jgi:Helicase conserved C-terminal domain